jgi:hypothetical protein
MDTPPGARTLLLRVVKRPHSVSFFPVGRSFGHELRKETRIPTPVRMYMMVNRW